MQTKQANLALIEVGNPKYLPFHEVFQTETHAASMDLDHIISNEQLNALSLEGKVPDCFVFHWNYNSCPHVILEKILQNPILSSKPLILYAGECEGSDISFWQEYRLPYIVRETTNLKRASQNILQLLHEDMTGQSRRSILARDLRNFFCAIQSENIQKAEISFESLKPQSNQMDNWYLGAHLLKAKKSFQEAIALIGLGLKSSHTSGRSLEPRFLHLAGTVYFKAKDLERSLKFLKAAHQISPLNPRRTLILGQVMERLGHFESSWSYYHQLYNQSKDYDAVYIPILEHVLNHAVDNENLKILTEILGKLSDRKLMSVCKRSKLETHHQYEKIIPIFCNEFFNHAKKLIEKDDYYGAVGLYQFVRNMIRPSDIHRKIEVTIHVIEALLASGDVKLAQKHYEKAMESFVFISDLHLKKRMETLKNEFDEAS